MAVCIFNICFGHERGVKGLLSSASLCAMLLGKKVRLANATGGESVSTVLAQRLDHFCILGHSRLAAPYIQHGGVQHGRVGKFSQSLQHCTSTCINN